LRIIDITLEEGVTIPSERTVSRERKATLQRWYRNKRSHRRDEKEVEVYPRRADDGLGRGYREVPKKNSVTPSFPKREENTAIGGESRKDFCLSIIGGCNNLQEQKRVKTGFLSLCNKP